MTREDALKLFNGVEDEEALQDAYEEQLFEYKQFFLSKAPIFKLFEGRIRKLVKLGEAYDLIFSLPPLNCEAFDAVNGDRGGGQIYFNEVQSQFIIEVYKSFQKQKNEIKRLISNASSAIELVHLAETLVSFEKLNASQWQIELETDEDIIVSKEPDPMYLLAAIKTYKEQGGESFLQLKNLENNPPEILIQEMKRLSLLFKKF